MQALQARLNGKSYVPLSAADNGFADAQLVLLFGDRFQLSRPEAIALARERFPKAAIVSCSSGAEICGTSVMEDSIVATALRFDSSWVATAERQLPQAESSFGCGYGLARDLPHPNLRHVLVFAEGLQVNGSALAAGFTKGLPAGVSVTGGLAADGERFQQTLVGLNGPPGPGRVVAVGLYGSRLRIGMGSLGGWDVVGNPMLVTRSRDNVLYELDGQPALTVYKQRIGVHAYALPASGLLYPLHVLSPDSHEDGVVRTLLTVDEATQSLTFAGDVPEGRSVQLMEANLDRLIDASGAAAARSVHRLEKVPAQFVLLISCIGRRLLLQRRTGDELEAARSIFGTSATMAGFYSYGELSPMTPNARCELHNQTMTITAIAEQ